MENPRNNRENIFLSLFCNIMVPVIFLKRGRGWIEKYFSLDTETNGLFNTFILANIDSVVFFVAILFPFTYFIFDLLTRKNINMISILGFINVLLNGGIGIFGSALGLSKTWFIVKEGAIPFLIGTVLLIMTKYQKDKFNKFILNDMIFDVTKINNRVEGDLNLEFERSLKNAGYYFIIGFFISSLIQFILASLIVVSDPGDPAFNEQVSTMTWVSYLAVLVPTILIIGKGYLQLIKDLEAITNLKKEDFLKA
tara:strand:+ start:3713 stop:4471 length:759 start_codon:yes stop_codon:yes gene_type:complete